MTDFALALASYKSYCQELHSNSLKYSVSKFVMKALRMICCQNKL